MIKEINQIIKTLNNIPEPFSVDGIIKTFEKSSKKIIKNFALYFYKDNNSNLWYSTSKNIIKENNKYKLKARNYEFGYLMIESSVEKEYLEIIVNHLSIILYSEKLSFLANRDKLTNLYNRGYLLKYLENKKDEIYSIIIIDLDKFKHYNDSYGHNVGDHVLKIASRVMRETIKNIKYSSLLARYGGEEFIIVIDTKTKKELFNIMETIRKTIYETDFSTDEYSLKATASFGGAIKTDNDTINSLIEKADKALYEAKETGRNKSIINNHTETYKL
ncbi:GGDEF domain-containing protein [Brachyspira pilosicoli]|uniref:GGDEF domain-containing protein n=1 Tax=Brachyspira pilosicoli TaxID=52584 RepID=UPI0024930F17|nr:GGDEF domain-containing protein [Brachyspira pilosicoli]